MYSRKLHNGIVSRPIKIFRVVLIALFLFVVLTPRGVDAGFLNLSAKLFNFAKYTIEGGKRIGEMREGIIAPDVERQLKATGAWDDMQALLEEFPDKEGQKQIRGLYISNNELGNPDSLFRDKFIKSAVDLDVAAYGALGTVGVSNNLPVSLENVAKLPLKIRVAMGIEDIIGTVKTLFGIDNKDRKDMSKETHAQISDALFGDGGKETSVQISNTIPDKQVAAKPTKPNPFQAFYDFYPQGSKIQTCIKSGLGNNFTSAYNGDFVSKKIYDAVQNCFNSIVGTPREFFESSPPAFQQCIKDAFGDELQKALDNHDYRQSPESEKKMKACPAFQEMTAKAMAFEKYVLGTTQSPATETQTQQNESTNSQPQSKREQVGVGTITPIGNPTAPVRIIMFADLEPFTNRFLESTLPAIRTQYIEKNKVALYWRDGSAGHKEVAQRCANDQGKFWEYVQYLMGDRETYSRLGDISAELKNAAGVIGLNKQQFSLCFDKGWDDNSSHFNAALEDVTDKTTLAVSGYPTFFINGRRITGVQPDAIIKTIDEELSK